MFNCATGASMGRVQIDRNLFGGLRIAIPKNIFSVDHALYLKFEQRRLFFDEAGWIELGTQPVAVPATTEDIDSDSELLLAAG